MKEREVVLPYGLEEDEILEGRGFNPAWESPSYTATEEEYTQMKSPCLCLLEQFMVSGMNEAVYEMVKAGYPNDVNTPMLVSEVIVSDESECT